MENNLNGMDLSIIVPFHNSQETIVDSLSAIKHSSINNYELIVVNDASSDNSLELSKPFTDKAITLKKVKSFFSLRIAGFNAAKHNVLVNIDSDIVVKPDTLKIISEYFLKNPDVDAITGILSASSPVDNFFSKYKNIYMNYGFKMLPKEVTFLYGSIYAIRSDVWESISESEKLQQNPAFCDDVELGQLLVNHGKKIHLVKELEVTHLKKYSFFNLLKNDFNVPKGFAQIASRKRVKPKFSFKKPVFAHTSLVKILSIFFVMLTILTALVYSSFAPYSIAAWFFLNTPYFLFIYRNSDLLFIMLSIPFTFLDHFVMGMGIVAGFLSSQVPTIDQSELASTPTEQFSLNRLK